MKLEDFSLTEIIELVKSNDEALDDLCKRVNSATLQDLRAAAPAFEELFSLWMDQVASSTEKAELCIRLAEFSVLDSMGFRSALNYAVRRLLPPFLISDSVVKSLGALDGSVGVREVALRMKKLQNLRTTAVIYQQKTRQFCRITGIDSRLGTITIAPLNGTGGVSLPIASAILNSYFFEVTQDLMKVVDPQLSIPTAAECRVSLKRHALSDVPDDKLKEIIQSILVPNYQSLEKFNLWWDAVPSQSSAASSKRSFADARSVLELYTLLDMASLKEKGKEKTTISVNLDDTAVAKLTALFGRIRMGQPKDLQMMSECISVLAENGKGDQLASMFKPLRGRISFWPAKITPGMDLKSLEPLAQTGVRYLPGLKEATKLVYTPEEFVTLALQLPIRCMNVIFEESDKETDREILELAIRKIADMKSLNSDLSLWIWKNAARIKSDIICSLVDMEAVAAALNQTNLPKEWIASQRDLKKALTEKTDFQKFLIRNADGDIPSIIYGLQKYRAQAGEHQSIMVKMSRISPEFKDYIESGAGSKLMGGRAAVQQETAPVTSNASHKRLEDELQNIINVQIPQNAAAVALARSFGDLRENAEYDAAKEQRRFLHRRRAELEKTLSFIDKTDFSKVDLSHGIVPGCFIRLAGNSGNTREFYLLGAWDGDPERNFISYKTKIGEAVMDHKVGDVVTIPDAGQFTVKSVEPLPEDLRKELAGE